MNLLVHRLVKGSLNNMSKSSLLKNARNYAEYLRKKERGPVKAFFHITKNENVPAIEQQGLLTNHPNANINSTEIKIKPWIFSRALLFSRPLCCQICTYVCQFYHKIQS